ncbi:Aminoalkylphosphonate N-acetyltransferase [Candidatus Methylobacter favarea]|uniref:Aminoalkylphosphonate N-acetyltransferase n=1 Tax=Candidatus Methylobacter favarea TaxID=2707345 RepID=A0A8S0Y618_9GAMM|nr:GNAT family N-acetyltransferase [Candidatus Methylobacter favarea]CAA9890270.1 Aminoalkylphosphonate N-acetyltransferase [Candidatus Methylobacter favarea]
MSKTATQVGPAILTDIPALCGLLDCLFAQELEFTPDHEAQSRGLARIINSPEIGHVLVARQGSEIAGMVCLLYTVSTALGARVALLEDMIIAPDYRGLGVGSYLLENAIKFARKNKCRRITLLTDCANEPAQRFYQRHGFALSSMLPLRLPLHE